MPLPPERADRPASGGVWAGVPESVSAALRMTVQGRPFDVLRGVT